MRISKTLGLGLLLALTGCMAPRPSLYQWGHYEDQIYARYNEPGKIPVAAQIEKLEADYQKANSTQKAVPPGFHAHLGYLYFEAGQDAKALQLFQTEKALFPESAVYIDRILAKAKR